MPVDDIQRRRKSIRVDPRIGFEMLGYESAALDFVEKMPQWRRAEPMQMLDVTLVPEPRGDFSLGLRLEAIKGYLCVVSFGA
jgi:hypothetical protein